MVVCRYFKEFELMIYACDKFLSSFVGYLPLLLLLRDVCVCDSEIRLCLGLNDYYNITANSNITTAVISLTTVTTS